MIYEYKCDSCERVFDVAKTVAEIDRPEKCSSCDGAATRQFSFNVHIMGAKVQHAEYNPGLGCVVKNKYHREELCKRKGLTEVGNDFSTGTKMLESFDKASQEKRKRKWDDL